MVTNFYIFFYRSLVMEGDYDTSSRIMEPEVLAYIKKFNLYTKLPTTSTNNDGHSITTPNVVIT